MATSVLQWAIAEALELLESFRLSSRFNEACVSAFGKEISSEAYLAALAALPPVSVVADTTLPIAHGAYASNPPRILLAESLLTGPPGLLKDVLLEEIGHYLDDRFNPSDSPGDEGAIWAALVQGRSLTAAQLKVLKQEDDHGLVILAGQQVPVELAVVAPLPNLAVDDYFNLPSRLIPGDTVSVSWRALNTGDAATPVSPFEDPAWVDSIYFSTDTELDPSDVLLGSKPFFGSPAYSGNPLPGIGDPNNFYFNYTFAFDHLRIPTDLLSNSGYLLLKLDSNNSITESNEYDNVLASTAISIGPADINLTPTNLEVTTQNLTWGRDYSFNYTLVNIGLDDTTTQWVDSLYFSTDATFDESDRSLMFWTLGRPEGQPVLASGMSNTFYLGSSLPENQPTQHGYFFLKTNPDADQVETNYTDNISAPIPVYIEADDLPDLSVSFDVETPAETLLSSQPLQLSWTVTNAAGTAAAPFWYDQLWFSPDPTFDDADLNDIDNDIPGPSFKIDASTIGYWPLFNGWAYTYNADNLAVPNDISGSGYFYVKTDATGLLPEQAESNNNTTGLPVTINQPDVNLVADPFSFSVFNQGQADGIGFTATADLNIIQQFYTGSAINFSWAVFNSGSVATTAPTWSDRVLFSRDQSISADDVVIAERSSGFSFEYPLQGNFPENPDSYYSVEGDPNLLYTIPSDLVGSGYLLLQVDAFDNQYETVETDNLIPLLVEFLAPPSVNLTATGVEIRLLSNPEEIYSGPLTWGQRISLGWNVAVSGDSPTWNYYNDTIVYSSDSIFGNSDDITIVDNVEYSYHEPSSSYGVTTEITLPNIGQASGLGYLLFKTDSYNNQPESNEEDNLLSLPVAINAVDLRADSVTAVDSQNNTLDSIEFGQPFTVSWTSTNADLGAVNGTWNDRIYLSRDNVLSADDITIATRSESRSLSAGGSYTDSATAIIDINAPLPTDTSGYVSESEPNDSIAQALNLQQNFIPTGATNSYLVKAKGSISTSYEGDYYRIYAGPSDQLRLYMYGFDTYLYLYDRNGSLLRRDDDSGGGLNSLINYTFPATAYAGEYYIRSAGFSSGTGNYGLDVTLTTSQPILTGNLTPGDYYLLLKTDIDNSVPESNESNNVVATISPLALTALSRADLTISGLVPAQEIKINSSFSVSWTVTNISSTDTARSGWFDSVYLSNDNILDAGDLTLASVARTAGAPDIEPGGNYSVTTNLTLPTGQSGNRYLIFAADSTNNRLESNESNNQSVIAIDIVAPDLVVSSATAPATASWSESIALSWSVANQGNGVASADWYDRIVLSGDQIFGNNDDTYLTEVWQGSLTPLSAGASYNRTLNVTLPSNSIGNQYLLIKTDNYNYEAELNDINNVFTLPINILAPDLYISSASAPSSAALNESISLSWTVTNQGIGTAAADWYDRVVISTDQIFGNSDDTLLSEVWQGSYTPLASGGAYTRTLNATLPITATGERFLLFKADNYNYQGETDENNNIFSHAINIVAPDLTVSSASAPSSAALNESISLSWTVTNQGIGTAAADWYDRVVISTDQIFGNSDDTYFTEVWQGSYSPLASGGAYTRTLNATLPITTTGERFLLFKADNYNNQGETDENNNVYSLPINISASDLRVTATSAPSAAILGETVELAWTVTNNGTGEATRDWYDRVYFSSNQILDDGDVQVTSELIGSQTPLAAGASYTISKNVTLPSFTLGNQYLLFVADRDNYQGEITENNNLAAVAISLTAPDLIVSNASVPASGTVGKSIEVSWTVQNQGTSAAPTDWYDRIYLSNDTVFDANADTFITQELVSTQTPLAAGASYSTTRNINLPNFATGNRYLIFVADGSGSQGETNEANNIRAAAINLNAPDLIVSDITAPVESLSGQPIEINWTVKNQGATTAEGTWYDYVYLLNTATNSTQYVGVFEYSGSLAAGASLNRTQSYSVPLSLTGNYRVVVTTDYYGQIAEGTQNESNNTTTDDRSISLQLAPVPNLQVTSVTAPSTAFSSQETVVQWTVKNVGTGATNAPVWYDHVYLSLDTTYDNTDTYLGQAVNPSYLNPDDSYSNSLTVTLPRGIDGNYYFLVQADAYNYVAEVGNEGDNWGSGGPTDVTLTPPPDLQVSAVNAPNGAFSGQPMNLSWTVTNAGTGRTLETAWYDRVLMSADATLDASDRILGTFYHSGALNAGANYTASATVNLPIGVAGSFFFFVQSDIYNNVYEHVFENNNSGYDTTATNITLTPPPDLEFESLTMPNNARSGSSLNISYRVTNFGATETPNNYWTDTFYLSSDNQLNTATDINLGSSGQYGILYPGDGYDRTANFALPNTLTGNYYVFGVTDSGDQVFELDNVNNITQSINQVQIVSQPADLVVSDAVIPTTGEAGKAISLQWTVRNQGTGDTIVNSWSDRLVVSNDEVLGDADDLTIASFTRTGLLAPNGSYSRSESVILPFALEGNYQLFVVTDSANSVYEGGNEANNASSAFPLTISRDTPDLQVTSITLPNTVTPGQPLTLNWTVANLGVGRTNSNYWYDRVYLSLDQNVSNDDINLGSVYRAGALDQSASYSTTGTFSLPINLNGSYYVLVQTDRDNNVIEGTFENNNVLASDSSSGGGSGIGSLPMTPAPSADLSVTAVDAPEQGIAGQSLSLTWTVVNNDANSGQNWYDAVYLSRDQVFDRNSDIYLGYRNHTGGLTAGDSYTATQSFNIPRGLGGRFYAFVVTDGGNAVYERLGEINNINYDGFSTELIIPPPSDLVVTGVTVPASGIPGQAISLSYTVQNQGTESAYGSWTDAVYLSSDNQWDIGDVLVSQVNRSGDVAAGASYTETLNGVVPGVNSGDYYVLVRSDIRNQAPEVNEVNNTGLANARIALDVEVLTLGTLDTGDLDQGQSVYYRFNATAGQAIRLQLDSSSDHSLNELYVRYGGMPTRGQFDWTTTQPFNTDPEIIIPIEQTGTYYVLGYGDQVIETPSYEILAQEIPFSITDVTSRKIGNFGEATLKIRGARFSTDTTFQLRAADGSLITAENIYLENSTLAYAAFDLFNETLGLYDVQANQGNGTALLEGVVTVQDANGFDLNSNITGPEEVRPNRNYRFNVNYGNEGDTDAIAPLLIIESSTNTQIGTTLEGLSSGAPLHLLGVSEEGLQDVLRPGELNTLPVYFNSNTDPVNFTVSTYSADNRSPIDWNSFEASIRPQDLTDAQWDNFIGNIASRVRTYGEYVLLLNKISAIVSPETKPIYDVSELFSKIYQQNANYSPSVSFKGTLTDINTGNAIAQGLIILEKTNTNNPVRRNFFTDDLGDFELTGLDTGSYKLRVAGSLDEPVDITVNLSATPQTLNLEVDYVPPKDLLGDLPPSEEKPVLTVASDDSRHVLVVQNGSIAYATFDEITTQWTTPITIPQAQGNRIQLLAGVDPVDSSSPILTAVWVDNNDNFNYAIANKIGDSYQWGNGNLIPISAQPETNQLPFMRLQGLDNGTPAISWVVFGNSDTGNQEYLTTWDGNNWSTLSEVTSSSQMSQISSLATENIIVQNLTTLDQHNQPTPYPPDQIGSLDYYDFRYKDFQRRNPGQVPPDYYKEYGEKYIDRFTNETAEKLSPEGQAWLERTRENLQRAIEDRLNADPNAFAELERNGNEFRDFAYDTHPDAYWDAGLKDLPIKDLLEIGSTPDFSDLLTPEGLEQVADIAERYVTDKAQELADKLNDIVDKIGDGTGDIVEGIGDILDGLGNIGDGIRDLLDGGIEPPNDFNDIDQILDGINDLVDGIGDIVDGITDLADAANDIVEGISDLIDSLDDAIDDIGEFITDKIKDGINDITDWIDDTVDDIDDTVDDLIDDIKCYLFGDCDDDNDDDGDDYEPPVRRPSDPNDILGPEGFGEDRWIDTDEPLRYTIRFENVATATAPAQEVFITQQLDADLDWRTFRVDDYGWSGVVYELVGNRAFHSTRIDLTETQGFYVDISATIDTLTGIANWRISTVDPTTGEAPLDAQQGFLPTNDENGSGEGFVTYSIRPRSTAKTGDVIDAEAEIIFDTEEPIKTPPIFNTLDIDKPAGQVNSLPETTDNPEFLVSWAGSDSGSAIASYTIYVSDNGGDFTSWLSNSTLTESTYQGQPGHNYQFYALATDNVGNIQEVPTTAQATIRVTGGDIPPAGVTLNEGGGNTLVAEDGSTDSYSLTLQSQPTAEVRISLSTSGGQLTLSQSELVFTPENWNTSQTVVISAVDDALTEGPHTATIQHSISSTDASYAALTIPALSVQVQDNDASITGKIWNDADGNRLNNGEAGLAGWTVFLDADLDGQVDPGERSTLSDETGSYRFDDLRSGVVSVVQVLQSGWRQTSPRLAMSTTASDLPLVLPSVDLGLPPTGLATFNFSHSNYLVKEDGSALTEVWIIRGGDLSRAASVTLRLSDGTATGCGCAASSVNNDFDFSPITVSFAPNQAMRLVPVENARLANPAAIRIRDDSKAETSEVFQLQLTNPSSAAVIGDQGIATVTIIDNDSASGAELLASLATTHPAQPASAIALNPAASALIDLDAFLADSRFASFRGQGFSTVIIDTGIDADHSLFGADLNLDGRADRLAYQYDFADGDASANDRSGHGTHIASIISSIATGSSLIALKVFKDSGSGSFADLERALQWVHANGAAYNIASVNLSLGDGLNWADSTSRYGLGDEFAALASQGVLISAAAGNSFYKYASTPGLSYPGVDQYVIPVGAVWTEDVGGNRRFTNGAIDFTTAPDRIASFSQRELDGLPFLAPGILIEGARAGGGTISMGGTSQATAFVSALATIAQQISVAAIGRRLTLAEFKSLLAQSSDWLVDGDDENDNVVNTGASFPRVNALRLAETIAALDPQSIITTAGSQGGSIDGPAALNTTLSLSHTINLVAGQVASGVDFGNQLLPILSITASTPIQAEGNSDSTAYAFTVTRSGDTSDSSSATWSVMGSGSIPADENDFIDAGFPSGTVFFAAGEISKEFTVLVAGDKAMEFDETFAVILSTPVGAILDPGVSSSFSTIINDDVNEAPTAVALTNVTTSLAENSSTTSRIKVADIAISDDALGSNTIALSGADAAAFEVEGTVLYLKAGTSLDYETKAAYAVTVSVSDAALSGSSPVSTGYSLSITDVNEAPTAVALTNATAALAENSSTASRNKLADIAISDDALGTNSIALSGADAAAFEVDGTVLYLKAGTSLDYETKAAYAVTVSVSDATLSGSSPVSADYSLSITDVDETPSLTVLSTSTFTEDSPAHGSGAVVAGFSTTNALAVALSDTLHYALGSGADAGKVLLTAAGLALVNAGSDLPAFLLTPSNGAISGPAVIVDPLVLAANDGPASYAITGTAAVGNTLAVTQLSPDPDGSGTAPGITWQTSAAGDSWSVVGTSSSYQLSSADEGKQLRALVSYSDGQGFAESVTTSPLTVPLLPTLAIAAPTTSLLEGNIGSTPFGFTITRTGNLTDESRVTWAVTGSGANPATGADFAGGALPAGTAVFAPGQDTVSLAVNVVGDGSLEPDDGFRIELNSPIGARLSATSSTGLLQILNDDQPAPTYSFVATPQTVYEGGTLHIAITTTNVAAGRSLWWQFSGSGISASDFSDGQLAGSTLIGSDGRAAFTKTIAADALVEPDETLEVRFYSDAARSQSVGSSLAITLNEPSVGFVTDGNDVITGTAAAELITGVPAGSGVRGQGSVDRLTGGAGADIFALGDSLGIYYDEGTTGLGTTDLAVITDFSAQDSIQLFGSSSGYRLVSGRYSGIAGVRIDALSTASGIMPEAIGFVQGATMATLSLTNPNQFLYI